MRTYTKYFVTEGTQCVVQETFNTIKEAIDYIKNMYDLDNVVELLVQIDCLNSDEEVETISYIDVYDILKEENNMENTITENQLASFENLINYQANIYNYYAERSRKTNNIIDYDLYTTKCTKYWHTISTMCDLMNRIDKRRSYTIEYKDTGIYRQLKVTIVRK